MSYVFFYFLNISEKQQKYFIKLNQFKIPDWFSETNNIKESEFIDPNINQIAYINITTAYSPELKSSCSFRIYSIAFHRNNGQLLLVLMAIALIVLLAMGLITYVKFLNMNKQAPVTITYKAINIHNKINQSDGFMQYISSNFHNSELTLELVSKNTGENQRRIVNYILENFGVNYKTYVNQIRISESKRLLEESDLSMGEIAFKIGFNSQSHFNRVFKTLHGISPSEFRRQFS